MDKKQQLSLLYNPEGVLKLSRGYSPRLARRYYGTKHPTESQCVMIRQMLNPKYTFRECPQKLLKLALADLKAAANEKLDTAKTLTSVKKEVADIETLTAQILEQI